MGNIQTAHILPLAGSGIHCAAQAGSTPIRGSPGSWAPAGTIPHFLAAVGGSSPHYTTAARLRFLPGPAALIEPLPAAPGPFVVHPLANPFHGKVLIARLAHLTLCHSCHLHSVSHPPLPPQQPFLVRCLAGHGSCLWALPVSLCTELCQKGPAS